MSESTTSIRCAYSLRLRRVLRSIGAVLAGLVADILLVGAIDAAMYATGAFPTRPQPMADHLWALALAYRLAFVVVGGYITARLAPDLPLGHALVLGVVATGLSVPFVLLNWNRPEFGPHWFAIGVATTALPLGTLGGWLVAHRRVHVKK